MVFDRISLVKAYAALKIVELNDGAVKDILFNKTSYYGTKTIDRFDRLSDLAAFINENYPYQYFDPDCQCAVTELDSIWLPLSFNLTLYTDRYATFVNNMRGDFESAQGARLNKISVTACQSIFKTASELQRLKQNYSCFAYMINQNQYVNYCEYVELIVNGAYTSLVEEYYPLSRHPDLQVSQLLVNTEPLNLEDESAPIPAIYTATTQFNVASGQGFTFPGPIGVSIVNTPIFTSGILPGNMHTDNLLISQAGGFNSVSDINIQLGNDPILTGIVSGDTMFFAKGDINVILIAGDISIAWTHYVIDHDITQEITITN